MSAHIFFVHVDRADPATYARSQASLVPTVTWSVRSFAENPALDAAKAADESVRLRHGSHFPSSIPASACISSPIRAPSYWILLSDDAVDVDMPGSRRLDQYIGNQVPCLPNNTMKIPPVDLKLRLQLANAASPNTRSVRVCSF